ncbi:uncharacterized protein Z520_07061 [Fonsecaea multimorphosa CBS 102226]|uniref:Uncharacterized protein n=1 Tax=Fonsecaea multimorphosa CBS 102226 TaxID=1442371 RepID=A0A0D2JTZ3_9EURO|nr:uncharacterized protein Z520_07061 [Fonsecaea multimorphosa CBS 102226]KIX96947.1 hypothetical protein Z520_07061 [Fonsecaea multimorphosa CBS 102226]OAL23144.1 hypothetical protein AYO22_06637 [Fonsecaea multimorphosa]
MYAGPWRIVLRHKLHPSALRSQLIHRSWSCTPRQAAKRDRLPTYAKPATPKTPGAALGPVTKSKKSLINDGPYYISPDLARTLHDLGFFSIPDVVKVLRRLCQELKKLPPANAIVSATTQQRFIQVSEEALGSAEVALMRDPQILRTAFHSLGQNAFLMQNRRGGEGCDALRMAFLAGKTDAGVDAAAAEIAVGASVGQQEPRLSPRIFDFIKAKAFQRSDWSAIILYLDEMSRKIGTEASARENYEVAKDLVDMVEPSKHLSRQNSSLLKHYKSPWRILHDAAQSYLSYLGEGAVYNQVRSDLENALRDGLFKYSDLSAVPLALQQPGVLEKHSKEWIELATQSARAGDPDSSMQLAFYYLRKDGWRPAEPNKKPQDWTGVEWLAVSAALSAPNTGTMAAKYLGLAHLLREHGYADEGNSWIDFAKESMGEAGLDPENTWHNYLSEFQQAWSDTDESLKKHEKSSEEFLGQLERA